MFLFRGARAMQCGLCCLFMALLSGQTGADVDSANVASDRVLLTRGVHEIEAPGALAGGLAVYGDRAFTVMTGRQGEARLPLFAAARFGRGRVVAGGHESFWIDGDRFPEDTRLLADAVVWAAPHRPLNSLRIVQVGMDGIEAALQAAGCPAPLRLSPETLTARLPLTDLLVLNMGALDGPGNAPARQAVTRFVQRGGGLLVAGPGWGWQEIHAGQELARDQSANQILMPMGIAWSAATLEPTGPKGFLADGVGLDPSHARNALATLAASVKTPVKSTDMAQKKAQAQAAQTLAITLEALPAEDRRFAPQVAALCARYGGRIVPDKAHPITAEMPFARLQCVLDAQAMRRLPADNIRSHPAAALFPGPVLASATRLARTLSLDTAVPDWHSTGLYAAPGEIITVRLAANALSLGLRVRIGAHTDTLWDLPQWERFPEITLSRPLNVAVTRFANPFGGPIYIEVPDGAQPDTIQVAVENAVEAPYYVKGKTTPEAWNDTLRNAPAPWAELQGDRCILTVPSAAVRGLTDPHALMDYWDEVLDLCADFYAVPRTRKRQERYCVDRQISAGYMHSGYPIMTWEDVAMRFTDLAVLRGGDSILCWGFYHEMGHNHQEADWTFEGTGEVTNNLFSLYACEKLNHARTAAHPAMAEAEMSKRLERYRAAGMPYAQWKDDPFLALTMYWQLRQAFGWEPFTRVFAEYRHLAPGEHPKTDEEKRDQWMVRFSRAVGHNLGPFFQSWGVPTSESARQSISNLPPM